MTTDIASGGTSNFLATKKYFRANHTTAKERVVVFVEDEIDSAVLTMNYAEKMHWLNIYN